jgi:hypothetical protein
MVTPRRDHTATLLLDGRVLVAGGSGDGDTGTLSSAELYDPGRESWAPTGSMIDGRSYGTATGLLDGRVLRTGPIANDGTSLVVSTELYDPGSGSWTATGNMATARILYTATLLLDGRVLVTGGADNPVGFGALASAELYDPASETWTATGTMVEARVGHSATLLLDGRVLVAGGWDGGGEGGEPQTTSSSHFASAELFDPRAGTWTATGMMDEGRIKHTGTLLSDGTVLVAGGGALASAELYDPASETWTATGTMLTSRQTYPATLLPDGTVLVSGNDAQGFAEIYDPGRRSWAAVANMDPGRGGHTATLLPDGTVLVTGGTSIVETLASAMLFDAGTRSPGASSEVPHSDGRVLLLGDHDSRATAEMYDSGSGS